MSSQLALLERMSMMRLVSGHGKGRQAMASSTSDVVRAMPRGSQFRPELPLPVLVTLHRVRGEFDAPASATAWTRDAVEVSWLAPEGLVSTWVPANDVRRGQAASRKNATRCPS